MSPLYVKDRRDLEHQVVTMQAQGWSIRSLARHFGLGRNTVRRILRRNEARRGTGARASGHARKTTLRRSKLDPFMPLIQQLLAKFPDITGVRMFEELREAGYEGGMTILTDRLRWLRPKPKKAPVVRF